MFRSVTGVCCWVFLLSVLSLISVHADPLPGVRFIPNKNQWRADIQFASRVPGGSMTLAPGRLGYYFIDHEKLTRRHNHGHENEPGDAPETNEIGGYYVEATFENSNPKSAPSFSGRSEEYYNFFVSADPAHWAGKVYGYSQVYYKSFYLGVDLHVYAHAGSVKYDLLVDAGTDPSIIRVSYKGADRVHLDNGNLYVTTPYATLIEKRPVAFQFINGEKKNIDVEFVLTGNEVSYAFPGGYDKCEPLLIDPILIFSTYSGSNADNWGSSATPGERSTLYSAGVTNHFAGQNLSGSYPVTPGAFQQTWGGVFDIGILKYDSTGSTLLYASYLGGSQTESPHSLLVNASDELIVLGTTSSADFPTTLSAFDRSFNGGTQFAGPVLYQNGSDIVVTRISADGSQLLASTFLGGSANDGLNPTNGPLRRNYGDQMRGDVIADAQGNIYVTSVTSSADFPLVNSFSTVHRGETDALVFKMNAELSVLQWSATIGGTGFDACHTIKFDSHGDLVVGGGTTSTVFPATPGAFRVTNAGGADGFVAKIANDGSAITKCTLTGSNLFDQVFFVDLNANDEVYVFGQTNGQRATYPAGTVRFGATGQFIEKFNADLSQSLMYTVVGSGRNVPDISPTAFLVNECGNIYIAGWGGTAINLPNGGFATSTLGLPTSPDAYKKTTTGNDFYFAVLADDAQEFLYGTYLGGAQSLTHLDGGTCRFDKLGIVYHAVCSGCNTSGTGPKSDFPTTAGAWSATNNSLNCNNAAFKFDLSSLRAGIRTNTPDLDFPNISFVCVPDTIVFENQSVGGEIFEWDLGDGTKKNLTENDPVRHAYKQPGRYPVKLKIIDRGTCKEVDSTAMFVTVYKKEITIEGDAQICEGDAHTLIASGGIDYEWKSRDGLFESSLATPVVQPVDTTIYDVEVQDHQGCVKKDTVTINVVPRIVPEFEMTRTGDCQGMPEINVISATDSLLATDEISFNFGDNTTISETPASHRYESEGLYTLTMTGDRFGCRYDKQVEVPIFELNIPNVITPQGDDKNEYFTIQYGSTEGVTPGTYDFRTSLIVYNRWGTVVYESDDYHYDWKADGLAAGVYYYEIEVEDHAVCRSWLQVLR